MGAEEGAKRLARAQTEGFQAFSKFLTWLERCRPADAFAIPGFLEPARTAVRLGITGPPGAGKSTLTAGLIKDFRARGLKTGVLAVDPSSPFSKGAILGDRIRYVEHTMDDGVFLRSLGTRGSLGGLSGGAYLMARAFDACGFDVLLIETVGVGQTELDVLHVADAVCVVLVPESGDAVQAMKAGLMEIANVFVVNKADRPGADGLARELEATGDAPVLKCVATSGDGVLALAKALLEFKSRPRAEPDRLRQEAKALRRIVWESRLDTELREVRDLTSFAAHATREDF